MKRAHTLVRRSSARLVVAIAIVLAASSCRTSGGVDEARSFTFGVVSDAQYCDRDAAGTRFYGRSLEKLAAAVEDLNAQDLAFTIHLGDFTDAHEACLDALLPIYDRLAGPHYHVLGNHDFDVAPERQAAIPGKLGLTSRYYDFRRGKTRFVVLDGGDVSLYARPEGSAEHEAAQARLEALKASGAPNAQAWNGAVGDEQLEWLRRTLSEAKAAGEHAIVLCHFPVYPPNAHNLWNDAEVIETLEASGVVIAWINGHNHAGGYAERNGIHYLTVHGMVETEDTNAYAVVRVEADRLEVDGRGREPDRVLPLRTSETP